MIDEQKLRELAGAATVGVWKANGFDVNSKEHGWGAIANTELDYDGMAENAAFIASANPTAILALLDELATLRSERTAWRVTAENAEAERDALKAEQDEMRATEAAWRKLNDTLLHQVPCCDVAAITSTNSIKDPESDCPYCNGTGESDSGGIHPWGAPATIPCRCMYEDPFHVQVSKFDALKAERDSLRAVNAELLEALEALEHFLRDAGEEDGGNFDWEAINRDEGAKARDAIRKATGKLFNTGVKPRQSA